MEKQNWKSKYVGPPQPHFKAGEVNRMVGKTIEWVDFGEEKRHKKVHRGDGMVIHFTDGTSLEIAVGSNIRNLGIEPPDSVHTDLMVFFRGEKRTKDELKS